MRGLISPFIILLSLTPALRADALDRHQIPASAVWLIHFDVDAARRSLIGQRIRDFLLTKPECVKAIEQAHQTFGVDPVQDTQGITVYGTTFAPDAGVVLARGKLDRPRIETFLRTLPGFHSDTANGRTLYFWTETAPNRRHDSAGAFFGADTIVIAPDAPAVLLALDVLDGKSPSLSSDSALMTDAAPGAILQGAATGLSQADGLTIQSPVVRQCESGSLVVGEQGTNVFVHARILTSSEETAARLRELIVGAKAMAEIQNTDNADLANLLRSLKISGTAKTLDMSWQYSSVELVKIVETMAERQVAATQPDKSQ